MVLLAAVAAGLLVLGWAAQSDCLCSPTAFYKNCWIRRFPGLLVDLKESQRRGAQVLKMYAELSSEQCGRTCCLLRNASCNLAVFYHGVIHENMNCLHVSCPALESCVLKARVDVVLYNITAGADPDLLVFEKPMSKEPNTHSTPSEPSSTIGWERCQQYNATPSSLLLQGPSSTASHGSTANTPTSCKSLTFQTPQVSPHSRAETVPPGDNPASGTSAASASTGSIASSEKTVPSAVTPEPSEVLSHVPTPPQLNSSKQHLNETKGYSGRNYTSDTEAPAWEAGALGIWLIPVILCSSLIFLCCCTVAFTAGCCSTRRGRYRPVRRRRTMSGRCIKYPPVKGSL
ncbi:MANS4 protein, partial [Rhinopomastus cyanomelas]|nr:MANS4 protein [Rhinopomastus cyanomelas]